MDFRTFLNLAEALIGGGTEAEWRTAVSRAYYGVFHVACDLLDILGFMVPHADRAHAYANLRLSNSSDDAVIDSGRKLKELRSRRNQADYDKRSRFSAADAEDAVENAYQITDVLDEALQGPLRTQVTEAIKQYERDVLKEVTWKG